MEQPGAVFSHDRVFRYELHRNFDEGQLPLEDSNPRRLALWVMLNPSTADEVTNDRTIGRCISFSKNWGCNGLMVGNCYAFRSSKPLDLYARGRPACIGPQNDWHLDALAARAHVIVAGWGNHCEPQREAEVLRILRGDVGRPVHVLGVTAEGRPMHPLYIKGTQPLELWQR